MDTFMFLYVLSLALLLAAVYMLASTKRPPPNSRRNSSAQPLHYPTRPRTLRTHSRTRIRPQSTASSSRSHFAPEQFSQRREQRSSLNRLYAPEQFIQRRSFEDLPPPAYRDHHAHCPGSRLSSVCTTPSSLTAASVTNIQLQKTFTQACKRALSAHRTKSSRSPASTPTPVEKSTTFTPALRAVRSLTGKARAASTPGKTRRSHPFAKIKGLFRTKRAES